MFWTGVGIAFLVAISPVILHFALRNEKIVVHKIFFIVFLIIADGSMISWYLYHIHRANITLLSLIKFYIEYIKTMP